jgi:hypothetical protein
MSSLLALCIDRLELSDWFGTKVSDVEAASTWSRVSLNIFLNDIRRVHSTDARSHARFTILTICKPLSLMSATDRAPTRAKESCFWGLKKCASRSPDQRWFHW